MDGLFDDLVPAAQKPPGLFNDLTSTAGTSAPAAEPTPPAKAKDSGLFAAPFQGAAAAVRGFGKTAQTVAGGTPSVEEPQTLAAQPFGWSDITNPKAAAEKILYGIGEGAPEWIGGIAGGVAGTALGGGPETGVGIATGLVGGALGAGAMNMAKTLGPYYAAALQESPNDHTAAFQKAIGQAGTSGAISGVGWAAFGFSPFKSMVEKSLMEAFGVEDRAALGRAVKAGAVQDPAALSRANAQAKWAGAKDLLGVQALGVQPAVAASGQVLQNIAEGKPAGEGVGEAAAGAVAGTAVPAIGHAGVKRVGRAISDRLSPSEPAAEPVPAVSADAVPKEGDVLGLKFPGAPSRRAKVDGVFDNGQSVRLRFDDGTARDYNTADVLRDRTAAPPPLDPTDSAPPPDRRGEPLGEAESFDLIDAAAASQPQPRARGPHTIPMNAEADQALRNADALKRRANNPLQRLSADQRTEMIMQAVELRRKYGTQPTAPEMTADSETATATAREAGKLGPLGKADVPITERDTGASLTRPDAPLGQIGRTEVPASERATGRSLTRPAEPLAPMAPVAVAEREGTPLTRPDRTAGELEAESERRYAPEAGRVTAPDQGTGARSPLTAQRYVDDLIRDHPPATDEEQAESDLFARQHAAEIDAELKKRDSEARADAKQRLNAIRSAAAKKGVETKKRQNPALDLYQFLAAHGGITPDDPNIGDLHSVLGAKQQMVPLYGALIRRGGMSLDEARARAEEAGYIGRDVSDQRSDVYQETGADDFLDAVDRQRRGNKVYSLRDQTTVQDRAAARAAEEEQGREAEAVARVHKVADALRLVMPLTPDEVAEAARAVHAGADPEDAVHDVLERNGLAAEAGAAHIAGTDEGIDDGFKRPTTVHPELAPPPGPTATVPRAETGESEPVPEGGAGGPRGPVGEGAPGEESQRQARPPELEEPPRDALPGETPLFDDLKTPSTDELAQRQRKADKERAEAGMAGRRRSTKDQAGAEGLPLFGTKDMFGEPSDLASGHAPVREWNGSQAKDGRDIRDEFAKHSPVTAEQGGKPLDVNIAAAKFVVDRGDRTNHEAAVAYDVSGNRISNAITSDLHDRIKLDTQLGDRLSDPRNDTIVHHNHPESRSLSATDIAMLGAPGLHSVLAHGHDGTWYAASLAPQLRDRLRAEVMAGDQDAEERTVGQLYRVANAAFDGAYEPLRKLVEAHQITAYEAGRINVHIQNTALDRVGLIDYLNNETIAPRWIDLANKLLPESVRMAQVKAKLENIEIPERANAIDPRSAKPVFFRDGMARLLEKSGQGESERSSGEGGPGTRGVLPPGGAQDRGLPESAQPPRQPRLLGLEEPQTAPEAEAGLAARAEAYADQMEKGPPGTAEAGLKVATPPRPLPGVTTAFLGAFHRLAMFPRVLAARDTLSAQLYNAHRAMEQKFSSLLTDWRERVPTFLDLAKRNKVDKVYGAEEVARLTGAELSDEGRSVVLRNDGSTPALKMARFSKPGDTIKLSPTETKAFFERRDMFTKAWADYREGAAKRLGWTGEPTSKAAQAAAESQIGSQRNFLSHVAEVLKGIEDHERRGYTSLMRFGDYYIHVTVKPGAGVDEKQSLGGHPESAWFSLVETAEPKTTMFGKIEPGGHVPQKAADAISDVQKRLGGAWKQVDGRWQNETYQLDHGYLAKKENVLRDVGLPAIDKLMIAMEGNVRREVGSKVKQGEMSRADADREKELWSKMRDALETQAFEELKAGYKKQANNIPGYSPDWNRTAGAYMHGTARNISSMMHRDDVDSAYDNIQQKHPDQGVKKYWRDWRANMEDPASPLSRAAGSASQAAFYWTLAANPSSAIIIALHGPQVAHAMLSMGMSKSGGLAPITAGRELYGALFNGIKALRFDTQKGLHVDHQTLGRDDAERAYLKDLAKSGELHAAGAEELGQMQAAQAKLFGPRWKQVLHVAGSNIAAADQLVRTSAALAAYRLAQQPGALDRYDKAWGSNQLFREMTQRDGLTPETVGKFMLGQAAFDWGRSNSIPLQRSGVGKVAFQFHQFQMRYLSAAWNLMANQGPAGKAAAGLMAANLWVLAGVNGLPFVQDVENGIDATWKFLRGTDPMTDARVWSLLTDHGMSKAGAEMMRDGPASSMFGVKLSNRLGFGDVASRELHGLDLVGAAPAIMWNAITGAKKRAESHQGADATVAQAAPAALRNPLRALDVYPRAGVKSQTGKTQYVKPQDLSAGDLAAQAIGFTPQKISRAYETAEYNYRRHRAKGRVPHNPYVSPKE